MTQEIPKEAISLYGLHQSRRIWWIKSRETLKRWVEIDMANNNYLKTIIVQIGKNKKYYFLNENIEAYVRAFEKGIVH
jgi:hypothetical protein